MPTVKIPVSTKLKSLPLETRLLMRLVTFAERGETKAELLPIARELGEIFGVVMAAAVALSRRGHITLVPINVGAFTFTVEAEARASLLLSASNFEGHLRAKRVRKARQQTPYLTPVPAKDRERWMADGNAAAVALGAPGLARKLANCFARMGPTRMTYMLTTVKNSPREDLSSVAQFFMMYRQEREKLFPSPPKRLTTVSA